MSVSLLSRAPCAPLSHRDRVRRVVLLCASFGRNAAYYRAGWGGEAQPLLSERHPDTSFWRQVNANFLDMAVLDWCKLFGDQKETPRARVGKHHWRRVVIDPVGFELALLGRLRMEGYEFASLIRKMRAYRDEFVAHLDDGRVMHIPELDAASAAVDHYYCHMVEREAWPGELDGLSVGPEAFLLGEHQCSAEATRIYLDAAKASETSKR